MAEESGQSSLTVNITRAEFREDIQTLRDEFRQHYATKEDVSKLETSMGELRGEINGLNRTVGELRGEVTGLHRRMDDTHRLLMVLIGIGGGGLLTAVVSLILQFIKSAG